MEQRGFKVSAVVLGLALAVAGSLAAFLVLASLLAVALLGGGIPTADLASELSERLASPVVRTLGSLLVALFAYAGGRLAARMESHAPFRHALAVGLAGLVLVARLEADASAAVRLFDAALLLSATGFAAARVAHRRRWRRREPGLAQPLARGAP